MPVQGLEVVLRQFIITFYVCANQACSQRAFPPVQTPPSMDGLLMENTLQVVLVDSGSGVYGYSTLLGIWHIT
eukprot:1136663-Pelagomonas_calceolata.AAC.3